LKISLALCLFLFASFWSSAQTPATFEPGRLLALEGRVEVARAGSANWTTAATNALLSVGDRVRTGLRSRATLQLSDRSILRLNELTTMEIRPPQAAGANAGFEQKSGSSYFFNRERPGSVEFRTPLASGAIRGTEFHLHVAENGRTEVALLDGAVDLGNEAGQTRLASGEQAVVEPGEAPRKTALLDVTSVIQWVLYYPAILDRNELVFTEAEEAALEEAFTAYNDGDLLRAVAAYPENRTPDSESERLFRAASLLAVGQVSAATQLIANVSSPVAEALRQMISTVKGAPFSHGTNLTLATEWMAESYALQARSDLDGARRAAERAVAKSPLFGFAQARLAELQFSFGDRKAAERSVSRALHVSERHAQAHALKGFLLAARSEFADAEEAFDEAIAIDPALANAWLGRGLVRIRRGRGEDGRRDLQVAATLEPQRSLIRSYLGKAWSHTRNTELAEKELRLAQKLDAADPTPWLYSAILAEQQNRVNEAIRDLEHSQELNDNRSVFRSRLLLDQDRAIRSANLARIYQDAGLTDWSVREASRAATYDYANYSAHQFLANSYEALRDPRRINLRYEAPAVSEYFIANLLAPVGATPLSATVSQQEYTRLFDRNHVGVASSTEYFSNGDWIQRGVQYGRIDNTDWALEAHYRTENGYRPNNDLERTDYTVKLRQQLTPQDTLYFEGQRNETEAGDVGQHYDSRSANRSVRIEELQNPNLFLGYHREWSPGQHTLALVGHVKDDFRNRLRTDLVEENENAEGLLVSRFLRTFDVRYRDEFEGITAELQQIATLGTHTVVAGARVFAGESEARGRVSIAPGEFPGPMVYPPVTNRFDSDVDRYSVYLYDMWQVFRSLHVTVGVAYDHVKYPEHHENPPLAPGEDSLQRLSPKAGVMWTPFDATTVRAAYTRSIGGVLFENSLRLEPTIVGGFNQTYRSLVPESLVGNIAAARFETAGFGIDQKIGSNTYVTVSLESLAAEGRHTIGSFERTFGQLQASPNRQSTSIDYRENSVSVAGHHLLGEHWAFGARYRVAEASYDQSDPRPWRDPDLESARVSASALLHELTLMSSFTHRCGFFSELLATFHAQDNRKDFTPLSDDSFWQLHAFVGYRFWRRHAEARIGVLNITDKDYRLNPLTLYSELPRERTFYASFRFYF
jgi:tetratricopeptide (TPR) repeat protein